MSVTQDIAQFGQDVWELLPTAGQAWVGTKTIVGGVLMLYGGYGVLKTAFNAASARHSGLHKVFKNTHDMIDYTASLNASAHAFDTKQNIDFIMDEESSHAIIAMRGEEPVILDFTKDKGEMTGAVIYTQIKSMIGVKSPEEIFKFAQNGWEDAHKIVNGQTPDGMSEENAERIRIHSAMRCSDARNMMFREAGRRKVRESNEAVLSAIGGKGQASNISRRGTFAFAWNHNMDDAPPNAIMIKPRTKSERAVWGNVNDTLRANETAQGRPIRGDEGIKIYANVRKKSDAQDLADVTRSRLSRWLPTRHAV